MKVGDLVMWIGKDSDHGAIGVITKICTDMPMDNWYSIQWSDGVLASEIHYLDIMALDDVPDR